MEYIGNNAERKRNRLQNYDYSLEGLYFLTICTHRKQPYFGEMHYGIRELNTLGTGVDKFLAGSDSLFLPIKLEIQQYVVMHNHLHILVWLQQKSDTFTISDYVQRLKRYILGNLRYQAGKEKIETLPQPFFHKSFYDRIVRNEIECERIIDYIQANPVKHYLKLLEEDKYIPPEFDHHEVLLSYYEKTGFQR